MYWIATLGIGIGVIAGLFGAGGSFLTVLALVHLGGIQPDRATTTSLVVVGGMSLVAVVPYAKANAVLWRVAAGFGLASMVGACIGGHLSTLLSERALLIIFLVAMIAAAVMMLWECPFSVNEGPLAREHYVAVVAGGLLIGGLTGMVGLGGGFAVVPLLVVFARTPLRSAVGTSILIIAMNTLAGLAGHLPHPAVDWRIAAYLGVAESVGGLAGARVADRLSGKALRRGFAGIMLVAAVLLLGNAVLR